MVWLAGLSGVLNRNQHWIWLEIYLVYILECAVSVPWALVVFKIFIEDTVSLPELWADLRLYFWKAMVSTALSGLVLGLALYNLWFYSTIQVSSRFWVFVLMGFVVTVFLYGLLMTLYQLPILFFQNPSLGKLFYRSFFITLGTGPDSIFILFFSASAVFLFFLGPFLWFFTGFVFLFSLYVVSLEKHLLKYKITYQDKPIADFLKSIDIERQRGWRDIFKPWEIR